MDSSALLSHTRSADRGSLVVRSHGAGWSCREARSRAKKRERQSSVGARWCHGTAAKRMRLMCRYLTRGLQTRRTTPNANPSREGAWAAGDGARPATRKRERRQATVDSRQSAGERGPEIANSDAKKQWCTQPKLHCSHAGREALGVVRARLNWRRRRVLVEVWIVEFWGTAWTGGLGLGTRRSEARRWMGERKLPIEN